MASHQLREDLVHLLCMAIPGVLCNRVNGGAAQMLAPRRIFGDSADPVC
jgi:hypothetical protein